MGQRKGFGHGNPYAKLTQGMLDWQKIQSQQFLDKYKENPKICNVCGCCILVLPGEKPGKTRSKKCCGPECRKIARSSRMKGNNLGKKEIHKNRSVRKSGKYICGICEICGGTTSREVIKICKICRLDKIREEVLNRTKGELLEKARNGRWDLYRVTLQKHARQEFARAGKEKKCAICSYSRTIDVAHIRAVADFPDTALLREINHPDNLIGLCPIHHWEFDNGFLTKEELGADSTELHRL